jgi:excisionase family DNA binding protein
MRKRKNILMHEATASEPWVDIRCAADHTGMSVPFLRKQVRLKRIPFVRAGTKNLRFRKSELDQWMKARSHIGELA